ncbi:MAG: hypothetical protein IPI67_10935 [Myxococcales bacterium]|nr:hypothetical protein [Myxococcales bacterium]
MRSTPGSTSKRRASLSARGSWLGRGIVLALIVLLPVRAHADPSPSDRAAAEALFRDAKKLFAKKQFRDACRKLEESQRLDPQGGTLLNLAVCHAREGRSASAWVEFQEAIDLAKKAKRSDRIRLAERELRQLEKKLARLTIEVPADARVPGLSIQRGGEPLGVGAWGTAVPVDPDVEVEIAATAEGYKSWHTTLKVGSAEQKTLVVPKLEKLPPKPAVSAEPARPLEKKPDGTKTGRIVAYVAGGVGLVGLGVGSYFGFRALSKKNAAEKHCNGSLCDASGLELNEQAGDAAVVSNIGFGVGLVGLAVGTFFFVTSAPERASPEAPGKSARVRVVPSIGTRSSGILMSGRW